MKKLEDLNSEAYTKFEKRWIPITTKGSKLMGGWTYMLKKPEEDYTAQELEDAAKFDHETLKKGTVQREKYESHIYGRLKKIRYIQATLKEL